MDKYSKKVYLYFLEHMSYPYFVKALTGNHFWKFVKELEELQFADSEVLLKRSEERVRKILKHAYENVPFYKKNFDKYGVTPEDFHSIDDLQKFPIVTKTDLKQNFPDEVKAKNISDERFHLDSTSGSTGVPFQFFIDRNASSVKQAARTFFNYWAGIPPASRRIWICSPRPHNISSTKFANSPSVLSLIKRKVGKILLGSVRTHHISSFEITQRNMKEILEFIVCFNPDYIESYASVIVKLVKGLQEYHLQPPSNLKTIISTSETLIPVEKQLIESAFKCKVVNRYGSREFTGSVAQSCPENNEAFHINTELVFLEVVGENGRQVAPGENGKIVITDLHNYAMPFIRYDMGDYAIWGGQCSCGRGFPVLTEIKGRSTESLLTPSGKTISPTELGHFLFVLRHYINYIREYQAVQHKINEVQFLVVPEDNFNSSTEKRLQTDLKTFFGKDVNIDINIVPEIKLEVSGKRLIIKSNISQR